VAVAVLPVVADILEGYNDCYVVPTKKTDAFASEGIRIGQRGSSRILHLYR